MRYTHFFKSLASVYSYADWFDDKFPCGVGHYILFE